MRTRAVLGILTTALVFSAVAGGCQIIAQLNVLQVGTGGGPPGTGGGGPSGPASSSGGPSTCTDRSQCPDGSACLPGPPAPGNMKACETCGYTPSGPMCPAAGCDSCQQHTTCLQSCDGGACDNTTLIAQMGPVQFHCAAGECTGTITCMGPFQCEVDCDMGACTGLKMFCDSFGPCVLSCAGMGCMNAKLTCGSNKCTILAPPPPDAMGLPYSKTCNDSCDCSVQVM